MKKFRKIILISFAISIFLFTNCGGGSPRPNIPDDTIYLRFAEPDFGGDWSSFKDNIDLMTITLPRDIYASGQKPVQFNSLLDYKYDYNIAGYSPVLRYFNPDMYYVFKPAKPDPVLDYLYAEFRNSSNNFIPVDNYDINSNLLFDFDMDYKLLSGKTSTISLKINFDNNPVSEFIVTNFSESYAPTLSEDQHYNFDVNVRHIKSSQYSNTQSINFVVMADGYNQNDISWFVRYVEDAFQSPAHFHELKPNGFHDHVSMEKVALINYYKTQLSSTDIDAYIILANNEAIHAYT
jgi:hypothetical protein